MAITVKNFVEDFKAKKIMNTPINPNAVAEYIEKTLEVKKYLPFNLKRQVVEMVVKENITIERGVKKSDSISQYLSFVVAMLQAHTNLEFSDDPTADYDVLAESGLLAPVIETFKQSYDESDILLKMALANELEDNNLEVLIGRFLDELLDMADDITYSIENKIDGIDVKEIISKYLKPEDLEKLSGFLKKYGK